MFLRPSLSLSVRSNSKERPIRRGPVLFAPPLGLLSKYRMMQFRGDWRWHGFALLQVPRLEVVPDENAGSRDVCPLILLNFAILDEHIVCVPRPRYSGCICFSS